MYDADLDGTIPPDLEIANYGFVDADMGKEIKLGNLLQSGFLANDRGPVKLRDIVKRLRQAKIANPVLIALVVSHSVVCMIGLLRHRWGGVHAHMGPRAGICL